MKMQSTAFKNAGYLLALVPQALLVAGVYTGFTWFSVIFFFVVLPFVRKVIGNDVSAPNKKPGRLLGIYLRSIPRLYFATWAVVLPWSMWALANVEMSVQQYAGFALAMWIVFSLNTAIAHELIHSSNAFDRRIGVLLDASVGYFHFREEHSAHHARTGHHFDGDAAAAGTSLYVYALRRYKKSLIDAWEYEEARLRRRQHGKWRNSLFWKSSVPLGIGLAFYYCAGPLGAGIYLFEVVGAAFSIQAITYLQHWGLSQKVTPTLEDYGFSWEDGCWMQACVTLNHAFHGHHHLHIKRPYYELGQLKDGLPLPASYPVMFVVALIPSFFTRIMSCRLSLWMEHYELRHDWENSSNCIGAIKFSN